MKYPIFEIKRRTPLIYHGITIFRAKKSGGPYLKDEVKWWRGINGFMIQTNTHRITFLFRRREIGRRG